MDKKTYGSGYPNTSYALCVLGLGMMIIGGHALSSPGSVQLIMIGACISIYGVARLHLYNRRDVDPKK